MTDLNNQDIAELRRRLLLAPEPLKTDIQRLLDVIDDQQKKITHLEKKQQVLTQQNMELQEEMENVRTDFGNQR